jgi:hypothetical protein
MRLSLILVTPESARRRPKKDGKPQYPETPSQRLSPGYAAQTSEGNLRPRVGALGPAILTRCKTSLIADWLAPTKKTPELNHLRPGDDERSGHLPKLIDDLVVRLGRPKLPDKDGDAIASPAAVAHGRLRWKQGYSSGSAGPDGFFVAAMQVLAVRLADLRHFLSHFTIRSLTGFCMAIRLPLSAGT